MDSQEGRTEGALALDQSAPDERALLERAGGALRRTDELLGLWVPLPFGLAVALHRLLALDQTAYVSQAQSAVSASATAAPDTMRHG
jgi:hypothetical protein